MSHCTFDTETLQALRKQVATAVGWTEIDKGWVGYMPDASDPMDFGPVPAYATDMNAMRRLFLRLTDEERFRFTGHLLMQAGSENREGIQNFTNLLIADTAAWARAFLLTLGHTPQ